jgi:hypothetical protein
MGKGDEEGIVYLIDFGLSRLAPDMVCITTIDTIIMHIHSNDAYTLTVDRDRVWTLDSSPLLPQSQSQWTHSLCLCLWQRRDTISI